MLGRIMAVHAMLVIRITLDIKYVPLREVSMQTRSLCSSAYRSPRIVDISSLCLCPSMSINQLLHKIT